MKFVYLFIFTLTPIFAPINCKDDYIPVLIWTSAQMPAGPTLALNKINRDLFSNYLSKKLSNKKPLIVIFMEQILSPDDFNWRDENASNPFAFLSNIPERVDFFPYVEVPHEAFKRLSSQGYKWKHVEPDWKSGDEDSAMLLMEFRSVAADERDEVLAKHDEIMASVTKQLADSRLDWICIYTARHARSRESEALREIHSWHVAPEAPFVPRKPLYLYKDDVAGLALMTKGPIQVHLPTPGNYTTKALEKYVGASFTRFEDTMDFVIWFAKYTLTLYMSLLREEWLIDSMKIQNENGYALKLWPRVADQTYAGKSCARFSEFQSRVKPLIKVEIARYKVVPVNEKGGSCATPYTVPFLCAIMFSSVVLVSLLWSVTMRAYKTPKASKSRNAHISLDVLSLKKCASRERTTWKGDSERCGNAFRNSTQGSI